MAYRSVLLFMIIALSLVNAQSKFKISKQVKLDKSSPTKIKYRSPDERRNIPLFPKIRKKFVITEKPIEEYNLVPVRTTLLTERVLMPTLKVTNVQDTTEFYRKPVTRRPLMKFKKFTMELTTVLPKSNIINNKSHRLNNFHSYKLIVNSAENESNESEFEDNDEELSDDTNEKNKMHVVNIPKMNSEEESQKYEYATEIDVNEDLESDRFKRDNTDNSHTNSYKFTSEEKDDLNEFIFVKMLVESVDAPKKTRKLDVNEVNANSTHSRIKRKINIIEEENFGSTVSGFKFTGREPQLNDLTYKNINS